MGEPVNLVFLPQPRSVMGLLASYDYYKEHMVLVRFDPSSHLGGLSNPVQADLGCT